MPDIEPGSGVDPAADRPGELVPSQRRLQRPPDFTGSRLDSFRQVFLRHGLPGVLVGLLCLAHPGLRAVLWDSLASLVADPGRYLSVGLLVFFAITAWAWTIDKRLDAKALGWIVYLLLLSTWEEWVFRLAIPYHAAAQGADLRAAAIISNLAFGLMHYFTLRWKWQWCLGAALGGMALSRQMELHFDLALVIGIHWVATFLNTPRLPGRRRIQGGEREG